MPSWILTCCIAASVLILWRRFRRCRRTRWAQVVPEELASLRLKFSEESFTNDHGRPMAAKVDQVFERADGALVLLESKHRDRPVVHLSDVVQLTAQAYVLAKRGHQLAPYAYVRLVMADGTATTRRVRLIRPADIERMYDRYWQLRDGHAAPGLPPCSRCSTSVTSGPVACPGGAATLLRNQPQQRLNGPSGVNAPHFGPLSFRFYRLRRERMAA